MTSRQLIEQRNPIVGQHGLEYGHATAVPPRPHSGGVPRTVLDRRSKFLERLLSASQPDLSRYVRPRAAPLPLP